MQIIEICLVLILALVNGAVISHEEISSTIPVINVASTIPVINAASTNPTISMHRAGEVFYLPGGDETIVQVYKMFYSCFPELSNYFPLIEGDQQDKQIVFVKRSLGVYDSGFMFEKDRLVGFISSITRESVTDSNGQKRPVVELHNVCVRKEDHGRGLVKPLIRNYLQQYFGARGIRSALVGLAVGFDTPDAAAAFTAYAKLGFLRWWEPCLSLADFNIAKVINSEEPAFPMSDWWLAAGDRHRLQQKMGRFKRFCMVKEWPSDDFYSLGSNIQDIVSESTI